MSTRTSFRPWRIVALSVLIAAVAGTSQAQGSAQDTAAQGQAPAPAVQVNGVKQIQQLIKRATAAVKAVDDTKLQIQKTVDQYNLVVAPETTNRKSAYSKLQKETDMAKKKQATIAVRGGEARAEADTLFKSWQASLSSISAPSLRAKSEQRLSATQARVEEIQTDNQHADELYASFMKALEDR